MLNLNFLELPHLILHELVEVVPLGVQLLLSALQTGGHGFETVQFFNQVL